jgi:hypothetical protein
VDDANGRHSLDHGVGRLARMYGDFRHGERIAGWAIEVLRVQPYVETVCRALEGGGEAADPARPIEHDHN